MVGSKLSTGNPQFVHTGREYAEKSLFFYRFLQIFLEKSVDTHG